MPAGRWPAWRGRAGNPVRRAETERRRRLSASSASLPLLLLIAAPARAEIGFNLSAASDERFRGESISDQRPVMNAALSYDDVSGFYAGITGGLVATRDDGIQPAQSVQYVGYGKRLSQGLSLDLGVTNHDYGKYFSGQYARHFAEAYIGLVARPLSGHLFYAPDYDGHGGSAVYGAADATVLDTPDWSITAHGGMLAPPREGWGWSHSAIADWRLGATRRFGRFGLSLDWVGATPDNHYSRWRSALVVSASRSF